MRLFWRGFKIGFVSEAKRWAVLSWFVAVVEAMIILASWLASVLMFAS